MVRHNGAVRKPPIFAPVALLAAAIAWTLTLAFGEPTIGTTAAAVAVVDLLVVVLVAIVGLVVARAQWARRFSLVVIGLMAAMALTMPVSNYWVIGLLLSGLAVAAVTGPSLDEYLHPPIPNGPPAKAVALLLLLLVLPGVTAFLTGSPLSPASWIVIVIAPLVAWTYGQATLAGLWAARVAIPGAGLLAMWSLEWWAILLFGVAIAIEAWLAWSSQIHGAITSRDPVTRVRSVPIPPELAPPEILAAAGLDDRGRRLSESRPVNELDESDQ